MSMGILPLGTPALREVSAAVSDLQDPAMQRDAQALGAAIAAFRAEHGFGRAVAAPQLGVQRRMIGLALPGWPTVIVNPEITWASSERMTLWDDCMCFAQLMVRVERHVSISLRYMTLDGTVHARERLSRADSELMQHEIDHLDGKLSFDRAVGANPIVQRSVFDADRQSFLRLVDYFPSTL